jgi:hypothetical protein
MSTVIFTPITNHHQLRIFVGYTFCTQNGGSIFEPFVYKYLGVNPAMVFIV